MNNFFILEIKKMDDLNDNFLMKILIYIYFIFCFIKIKEDFENMNKENRFFLCKLVW